LAHRSRSAPHVARRARIILPCAEDRETTSVAKRLHVSPTTVCKWRTRFLDDRLDGLFDEPRPGTPRRIDHEQIEQVVIRTLETTPAGATHWSVRDMAKASGISRSTVNRIWRAFGLRPHRSETFKLSTDPLLIDKVRDTVGLYLNPPDHAVVLCVDEKAQIYALDRTQPLLPMRPGQVERRTHGYKRHGTTSLFAALDVKTSHVITQSHRRHRSVEFRRFLDAVEAQVPRDDAVHLILDTYGTHKTPIIWKWLAKRPRFYVHFTPTYGSWLNLVGAVVLRADDAAIAPRRPPERRPTRSRDHGLHRRPSCRSEAVRLDQDRRRDPGQHRPLCTTDPGRLAAPLISRTTGTGH
jgi:transposase